MFWLRLEAKGVSRLYPGFDILTIADGKPGRMIELSRPESTLAYKR